MPPDAHLRSRAQPIVERNAVVVTALRVEYQAVRARLKNPREVTHKRGTIYEVGSYQTDSVQWNISIVEVGQGNESAAIETERAIAHFSPQAVFFVGVAGGVKDVQIGDVVVAAKVVRYEWGSDGKRFIPRPDTVESTHAMIHRARVEARGAAWASHADKRLDGADPMVYIAAVAAGSKVVKSKRSATARMMQKHYGDVMAVEMEGSGFLEAVHANKDLPSLLIRGISDLLDGKELADRAGSQRIASKNAVAFLFATLDSISGAHDRAEPEYVTMGTTTGLGLDVKERESSLTLMNSTGTRARWDCRTRVCAVAANVRSYYTNLVTDGRIEDVAATPGSAPYVIESKEKGQYLVITRFEHPLSVGQEVNCRNSCEFVDSFTADAEHWFLVRESVSERVRLVVVFPRDRPFKSFEGLARVDTKYQIASVQPSASTTESGEPCLIWEIAPPVSHRMFKLRWHW